MQTLKTDIPVEGTPFNTLLKEFENQQQSLYSLVSDIEAVGHRLSNTDFPVEQNNKTEVAPNLPFNDGGLMEFYNKLQSNQKLIDRLRVHSSKICSLI